MFVLLFIKTFFIDLCICPCACLSVCAACVCGGQKRTLDSLALNLGAFVSDCGAGNWSQSPLRAASDASHGTVLHSALCVP